jgi:hypothetical protein
MGKRSGFARRPMDAYATPREAVLPLLPFIGRIQTFAEPCAGDGYLIRHLEQLGLVCGYAGDLRDGKDALFLDEQDLAGIEAIITNPPWTRELLHPLIGRFQQLRPTWLLFDADWCHTRQAGAYLGRCSHIVTVGRVKWIPDSPSTGKDNAAWYRFDQSHQDGPRFFGRMEAAA